MSEIQKSDLVKQPNNFLEETNTYTLGEYKPKMTLCSKPTKGKDVYKIKIKRIDTKTYINKKMDYLAVLLVILQCILFSISIIILGR